MLSPALGAVTAVWLMLAPALALETGARADLAIASGIVAFVLSPLSIWSRHARGVLAAVGFVIALLNFVMPCGIEALASLATCSMTLIIVGLAPSPVRARRSIVVPALGVPRAVAPEDEVTTPSRALRAA